MLRVLSLQRDSSIQSQNLCETECLPSIEWRRRRRWWKTHYKIWVVNVKIESLMIWELPNRAEKQLLNAKTLCYCTERERYLVLRGGCLEKKKNGVKKKALENRFLIGWDLESVPEAKTLTNIFSSIFFTNPHHQQLSTHTTNLATQPRTQTKLRSKSNATPKPCALLLEKQGVTCLFPYYRLLLMMFRWRPVVTPRTHTKKKKIGETETWERERKERK